MYRNVTIDASRRDQATPISLPTLIRDYIDDPNHKSSIHKYLQWHDRLDWSTTASLGRRHELVMVN